MNPSVRERMLAEAEETIPLPIKFVFLDDDGFYVLLYREQFLAGERDANSDIPWGVWKPGEGIGSMDFFCTVMLNAGMHPHIEAICQEGYDAWKES